MGTHSEDCEDFYLHLSSSDALNGSPSHFNIALPAPRSLKGLWKMALKEISYTKWNKERSLNQSMEFIIYAEEADTVEFNNYYRWLVNERVVRQVHEYNRTKIPGIPNARVVSFLKEPNHPVQGEVTDPVGYYENPEDFMREVNEKLHDMFLKGVFHAAPFFYMVDSNGLKTVMCSWNYAAGHWRKIHILPILGADNRRLLGIPKSYQEGPMLRKLMDSVSGSARGYFGDMTMGEEGFTQKTDNMFVLCNLVTTTGARPDMEGKILRVIPNKQEEAGTSIHLDFTEDYYSVTPKSSFFSVFIRLVSSRDYRDLNLTRPVSVTLHFQPVTQCKQLPRKVNA